MVSSWGYALYFHYTPATNAFQIISASCKFLVLLEGMINLMNYLAKFIYIASKAKNMMNNGTWVKVYQGFLPLEIGSYFFLHSSPAGIAKWSIPFKIKFSV